MSPDTSRRGSTLLELLACIVIIGLLTGLLLAAVQKVRAAADRIRCANNLKQLGLACHMYHDVEGALPPSVRLKDTTDIYPKLGWQARLLPYLEQQPLWDQTVRDYQGIRDPLASTPAHANRDRVVPLFGCPSDDRLRTAWVVQHFHREIRLAMTSYLGNSGTNHRQATGVLYENSRVQFVHVADGASNTLLAGERPPSPDLIFGWWYAASGLASTGALDFTVGAREISHPGIEPQYRHCGLGPFHFRPGRLDDYCGVFHNWSLHPGGANFVFADGAVRFLDYSADEVLPALATRAGGEVASPP